MPDTDAQKRLEAALPALLSALEDLRDSMVKGSMLMHDLRFEIEKTQREAAARQLDELLGKLKRP